MIYKIENENIDELIVAVNLIEKNNEGSLQGGINNYTPSFHVSVEEYSGTPYMYDTQPKTIFYATIKKNNIF